MIVTLLLEPNDMKMTVAKYLRTYIKDERLIEILYYSEDEIDSLHMIIEFKITNQGDIDYIKGNFANLLI